jgi:hypothetical protein
VEDTENEPIGRGTLIKIHLKEEAQEYLEEAKLKELVGKYSEFINFPIFLLSEKEVEVPIEEDASEEAAGTPHCSFAVCMHLASCLNSGVQQHIMCMHVPLRSALRASAC